MSERLFEEVCRVLEQIDSQVDSVPFGSTREDLQVLKGTPAHRRILNWREEDWFYEDTRLPGMRYRFHFLDRWLVDKRVSYLPFVE